MKFILTLLHPEPWMRLWMPGPTPQDSTWRHNPGLHRGCHVWCGSRGMPVVCNVCPYGHTNVIAVRHVNCKKMYMYLYFTMYFIRNDIMITEPRSTNQGAPSVSTRGWGVLLLCRGAPCRLTRSKDIGLLPSRWGQGLETMGGQGRSGWKTLWTLVRVPGVDLTLTSRSGVLWTPGLPSLRTAMFHD